MGILADLILQPVLDATFWPIYDRLKVEECKIKYRGNPIAIQGCVTEVIMNGHW